MKWYNPLAWFPWSRAGRQTLIYIMASLSGPALTVLVIAAGYMIYTFPEAAPEAKLKEFAKLAGVVALALLIVILRDAAFVSIRAFKIGKDGLQMESQNRGSEADEQ